MKETTMTTFLTPIFSPTMKLRWVIKIIPIDNLTCKEEKVLQQLWQSSNGIYEWIDIEIETI